MEVGNLHLLRELQILLKMTSFLSTFSRTKLVNVSPLCPTYSEKVRQCNIIKEKGIAHEAHGSLQLIAVMHCRAFFNSYITLTKQGENLNIIQVF